MTLIKLRSYVYAFCFKLIFVDSRILSSPVASLLPSSVSPDVKEDESAANSYEKVFEMENVERERPNEESYSYGENTFFGPDEKCAILVMSNQGQNSLQQSLLRKYRYNQHGDLIPGSVQYFVKFPQNQGTAVLVPLKDKAFSPSGGFVRYYKEIPPIPQSWRR